jgi:hypothetical protein
MRGNEKTAQSRRIDRKRVKLNTSATDAISGAARWTKKVLFAPFSFRKWLVLGFCSFIASIGQGGGCHFNFRSGGQVPDEHHMQEAILWVNSNLLLTGILTAVGLFMAFGIFVLLLWLSSRGIFMFIDGVVRDRAAVKEPWKRYRSLGNSFFLPRFFLGIGSIVFLLTVAALSVAVAWPDIALQQLGTRSVFAISIGGLLLLPAAIAILLANAILRDFIAPTMYRHNMKSMEAIHTFWTEIFLPNPLGFVFFYLLKIVLNIAAGIIIILGTCLTCCLAALPYISSVVFLPVAVFFRSYPIFYLEQYDPGWQLIQPDAQD